MIDTNGNRDFAVRVLLDSGSQKSLSPLRSLRVLRQEFLGIRAFGSKDAKRAERAVAELELQSVMGREKVRVEAFVVDVLIGSNFLRSFQNQEIIRGETNEPVAVKTKLGWVLSGYSRGKSLDSIENVNVNFVVDDNNSVNSDVNKLWDLDSVGVRQSSSVHTDVVDSISYNGDRYSVALPWKVGHKQLPSNSSQSLIRLKSQMRKLKNDPKIMEECDKIIKEQEKLGIIEKVVELGKADKVHYLEMGRKAPL